MKTLEFYTPVKAHRLLKKLQQEFDCQQISNEFIIHSFQDSFDWRLYRHDLSAEFVRSQRQSVFILRDLNDNTIVAQTPLRELTQVVTEFHDSEAASILRKIVGIRALLELSTVDYEYSVIELYNKKHEVLARLHFCQYDIFKNHLRIEVLKDESRKLTNFLAYLNEEIELMPAKHPLLHYALKSQGRKPKDYTGKLRLELDGEQRADQACQQIYNELLNIIKANESGIIHRVDTEFLHDFRVAVRRTQCGLKQIGSVFPESERTRFLDFFNWLGEITNESRDLDVHLLNFEHYKTLLDPEIRNDLNPLHNFLQLRQEQAHRQLIAILKSPEYLTALHDWEKFLKHGPEKTEAYGKKLIKNVADQRINKTFERCLQQMLQVTESHESHQFHDLRKTCKKLRYLLEFFQSLYPEDRTEALINNLKHCQDILGEAQDNRVYLSHLKHYRLEMEQAGVHQNTLQALDSLVDVMRKNEMTINQRVKPLLENFYNQYSAQPRLTIT